MRRRLQSVLLTLALSCWAAWWAPMLARAHMHERIDGSFFVHEGAALAGKALPHVRRARGVHELDASAAGAALTLLVGSVAVIAGKRRRQ